MAAGNDFEPAPPALREGVAGEPPPALLAEGKLVEDELLDAPFALTGEAVGERLGDGEGEEVGDAEKRAVSRSLLLALPASEGDEGRTLARCLSAEGEDGDPVCCRWLPEPEEPALRLPEAPSWRCTWFLPCKLRIGEADEEPLVCSIDRGRGEAEADEGDGDGAGEDALL